MPLTGRDEFAGGHGHMRIKLFGLFALFNERGTEIDQGSMVRYLSEIIWFPTAWLADYIHWEAVDDHHARATMHYARKTVSGVLTFGDDGRFLRFEAPRYRSGAKGSPATLQPWVATSSADAEFEGLRVSSDGTVSWHLPEGDHTYFRARVFDVGYGCGEGY